jgi:hypothetical protein
VQLVCNVLPSTEEGRVDCLGLKLRLIGKLLTVGAVVLEVEQHLGKDHTRLLNFIVIIKFCYSLVLNNVTFFTFYT